MTFDLATYQQRAERLRVDDIDFEDFRRAPLQEPVLRCVRYAHDVEFHTACYLRNLLNTRAHADPDTTAFLVLWSYEEYWHGDALTRVLAAHDEVAGAPASRRYGAVSAVATRWHRWPGGRSPRPTRTSSPS